MTLDEMISVFKNGDLQDIDYELMINAEHLLYWLTEYRAMISGRHSDSLSERLASHLVWTESNSYECPITLAEDLQEAISNLNDKDNTISNLIDNIKCLQGVSRWIPCSERLPFEPCVHVLVTDGVHITESWYEVIDGEMLWIDNRIDINFGEVTHWMPLPQLPKEE